MMAATDAVFLYFYIIAAYSSLHHIPPRLDHFRINSARVVLSAANGIRYIYAGCVFVIALRLHNDMRAFHNFLHTRAASTLFRFVLIKHHGSCSRRMQRSATHPALEAHF
jgi:hypothetical protein